MTIDIEALAADLLKAGTDERMIRAIGILAKHVNLALTDHDAKLEDRIDDRIDRHASQENYREMMRGF